MKFQLSIFIILFSIVYFLPTSFLCAGDINPQAPRMGMYSKVPPFLSSGEKSSVMLMFDNSWNMYRLAYQPQTRNDAILWNPKFSGKIFDHTKKYYGLFTPESHYTYNKVGDYFEQASHDSTGSGLWSGNFLNWLTMRRIDIVKKALTGGVIVEENGETFLKADCAANQIDMSIGPFIYYRKKSNPQVTPYNDDEIRFRFEDYKGETRVAWNIDRNYLWVRAFRKKLPKLINSFLGKFRLKIKIPSNEVSKIKGVIQKTSPFVRYGLTFFNQHDKNLGFNTQAIVPCRERERKNQGGIVKKYIGADIDSIIKDIRESRPDIRQPILSDYSDNTNVALTPLAETLHTVTGYFKKDPSNNKEKFGGWSARRGWFDQPHCLIKRACSVGPRYNGDLSYKTNNEWDPFFFNNLGKKVHCSKAFVILLTAGKAQNDWNIPKVYQKRNNIWKHENYLGNIAYHARHTDLRTDEGMKGVQNLTLYPVYAFGNSEKAMNMLIDAAKQGGFDDTNGNGEVDDGEVVTKYIKDSDGKTLKVPENFFYAKDGYTLEDALQSAIEDIKKTPSSGTSTAVLDDSIDGSGATFQTLFSPLKKDEKEQEVAWTGDIYALLIDAFGNSREDTNGNQKLDMVDDLIIITTTSETGDVSVSKYKDKNGNGLLEDDERAPVDTGLFLDDIDIKELWSGGERLAASPNANIHIQRSSYLSTENKRYLFTYFDTDNNGKIDSKEYTPFTESLADNNEYIGWFLGTNTGEIIRDFNDDNTVDKNDVKILINYIRGKDDITNLRLRPRQYNDETWRLGDIINSSPIAVQAPFAGYDTTYNNRSYRKFKRKYSDRRTMIYTGSNDGIFHAFNGGFYQKEYTDDASNETTHNKFWPYCEKNNGGKLTCRDNGAGAIPLGQEMWGYIPQSLLPHLQWLPQKDYRHIYYNDLPPFIFEAQLWPETGDDVHAGGWGTLLIGGMKFGGGSIEIDTKAFDGNPSTTDKRIMRSAYFLMDITDPEKEPVLLDEFTIDTDDRASFTTVLPSLEYVTKDDKTRDWYLVFGTGPTTLQGESSHKAKVFVSKLPSLQGVGQGQNGHKDVIDTSSWERAFEVKEQNSFISDFHGSDFQVGSSAGAFTTDAIYFGTIAGNKKKWTGKIHRIVVQNGTNYPANVTSWVERVLFDAKAPISIKPQVSLDDKENVWVYFGTGRFLYALYDKEDITPKKLYGVKVQMTTNTTLGEIPQYRGSATDAAVKEDELLNTTNTEVYAGTTAAKSTVKQTTAILVTTDAATPTATNFAELETEADSRQGWVVGLQDKGERLVTNPVIRSQAVNFNTFIPTEKMCELSNSGSIYDFYYKTGTAFWKPIMGENKNKETTVTVDGEEQIQKLSISRKKIDTLISSSAFQNGEGGVKQIVQKGDGSTESFSIETPGKDNSGRIYWEDKRN